MKKKRFLFSLLMAIVMMAMSPQKMWADDCENCSGSGKETCDYCYGSRKETCEDCQGSGIEGYCIICSGTGKENCDDCSGSGKRTCEDCQGSGKGVECGYCEGTGYDGGDKCSHCGGSGYNACDNCGGSGKYDCDNCSGSGKYTCHNCGGRGGDTCSRCDGSGKQTCTGCSGSGGITCYLCDGSGKVAHAHQPLTEHPAVDATLASDGNSAYWSCSTCGKYFSDAEGKNEIAENSWVKPKTTNISLGTRYIDGVLYYEIGNSADLCAFSDLVSARSSDNSFHMDLNAILTNDIEFDSKYTYRTIGVLNNNYNYWKEYTGIFDGNGHTINSLKVTAIGTQCAMFHKLNNATVKNLSVTNIDWTSTNSNSGFVAEKVLGTTTLSNIYIQGKIALKTTGYCFYFGTIATDFNGTITLTNCGVDVAISFESSYSGTYPDYTVSGFFNDCTGTPTLTYNNCYFSGSFTGKAYTCPFNMNYANETNYNNCYAVEANYSVKNANITYKAPSAFTSGEVAYLLNGSQDAGTWRQKLSGEGVNTSPVLKQTDDNKVYYGYADCVATEKTYANSALHATQGHSFTNKTEWATSELTGVYVCDHGCGTLSTDDPTYTRTMKNQWGTVVVPFDVAANVEEYDLYSISSADDEELTLTKVDDILSAGTPVLVRMSEAAKDAETGKYNLILKAANATLNTSGTLTSASENVEGLTLKGSYDVKDITEVSGYIISNNAFWNIQTIKGENRVYNAPFRAYLEGSTSNNAKMLSIGWNDDEDITAVETLDALTSDEAQYFDINGRRLNDLQQGINIVKRGNKTYKVIIK